MGLRSTVPAVVLATVAKDQQFVRDVLVGPNRLMLRCGATGAIDVGVLHNRGLVRDDRLRVT